MKKFLIWLGFVGRTMSAASNALESQVEDFDNCKKKVKEYNDKKQAEEDIKQKEAPHDELGNVED